MSFAWSRTTYALWRGIVFNFEDKWGLDYFLAHAGGAKRVSCGEAHDLMYCERFVRVPSSRSLGVNVSRKQKVKQWKEDRRRMKK